MAGDRKLRIVIDGDASGAIDATDKLDGKLSAFSKGAALAMGGAALGVASFGKAAVGAASDMNETMSKVQQVFGKAAEVSAVTAEQVMADKTALGKAEAKYAEAVEAMNSKTGKARETAAAKVEEWGKKVKAAQNQVAENERLNAESHAKFLAEGTKVNDEYAKSLEKWASTAAKTMGQSKQQALDAAVGFATFGKAAGLNGDELVGFSEKLTGLASDMASFSNTTPEDAIEALGAALRGENEPIRRYGVLLDDATLKAKAMEMGLYKGTGTLSAQAKTMAAYQVILDQTKDAQGDFARTSDGMANKQRILHAQMEDLKVKVGQALLPAVMSLVSGFASLLTAITPVVGAIADRLGPVLSAIAGFIKDNMAPVLGALAVVAGGALVAGIMGAVQAVIAFNAVLMANPIALVVLAVAGLVAGVIYAYQHFEKFRDIVDGVGRFLRDQVLPLLVGFVTTVTSGFAGLAGLLTPLWEPIKQAWSAVWEALGGIFTGHWEVAKGIAVEAFGKVAGWIGDIVEGVQTVWSDLWDGLKNAFGDDGPWGVVRGIAVDGLGTVKEWVGGIKTEVGGAWSDVWEFLRGLFDLAWSNVKATVGGGIGSVWEWVQGIGGAVSTAWSGVWEALSAPFLLAWDGIKEVVEPAINGLATAFGAISRAVETLIGWLGRINWPDPPDWMKSIIGAGGDVIGGVKNWLSGGGPFGGGGASASPAPGASRGGSVVTAPAPAAARPTAPPGSEPGDVNTDVNGKQWVVQADGTMLPLGSGTGGPGDGNTAQGGTSYPSSGGAGSGVRPSPTTGNPYAGAEAAGPTPVAGGPGGATPAPTANTPGTSGGGGASGSFGNTDPAPGGAIAKGKAAGFIPSVAGYAQSASSKTGIPASVIIAQWAIETQWGEDHKAHPPYNNMAGIGGLGHYVKYASINDFITTGYAPLMNSKYPMVAAAAKSSGVKAACIALGKSPWAEHHYRADATGTEGQFGGTSGTEGLALWNVIKSNNLTQYDSGGGPPESDNEYSSPSSADVGPQMFPLPAAVATSAWGDPDKWRDSIVPASGPGGETFSIQSKLKGRFEGFLADWVARGGRLNPSGRGYTVGSYNVRKIDNSTSWSNHSFGAAIDINENTNPYQSPLKTDMYVPAARAMAKKWGLRWGGDYSGKKDPMHFEFAGAPSAMARGGIVDQFTFAQLGESGIEAVLPLTNPSRMVEIVNDARVLQPIVAAIAAKQDDAFHTDRSLQPIVAPPLDAMPKPAAVRPPSGVDPFAPPDLYVYNPPSSGPDPFAPTDMIGRTPSTRAPITAKEIGLEVARALISAGAARPVTFNYTGREPERISPRDRLHQVEMMIGAGL